jgi:hypothetical protein
MRSKALKRVDESIVWQWEQELADWVDQTTGEVLTEYDPSDRYRSFVETIGTVEAGEDSDRSTTPPETEAQLWHGKPEEAEPTFTEKSDTVIESDRFTWVPPPILQRPSKLSRRFIETYNKQNEKSSESERKKHARSSTNLTSSGAISRSKRRPSSHNTLEAPAITTIEASGGNEK